MRLTDSKIRMLMGGFDVTDDAIYSEYETDIAIQYNGCGDTSFSDLFLTRLWNKLRGEVYKGKHDYDRVNILVTNNLGVKSIRFAPQETSSITALSNEFYCHLASKAILQHKKLNWSPDLHFMSLADYYYAGEEFSRQSFDLVINTYEENDYYKSIDPNKRLTALPNFLYTLVRSTEYGGRICTIIPNARKKELEEFELSQYVAGFTKTLIAEDSMYTAYLILDSKYFEALSGLKK